MYVLDAKARPSTFPTSNSFYTSLYLEKDRHREAAGSIQGVEHHLIPEGGMAMLP